MLLNDLLLSSNCFPIILGLQSADCGTAFAEISGCTNQQFQSAGAHKQIKCTSGAQKPTKMRSLDFQCNFSQSECIQNLSDQFGKIFILNEQLQSGKTNHFDSSYLLPRLQQISKLKQTTMLE